MPPPAVVYVAAILTGVAAAIAFKEFIYEPHIAPKLEEWASQFIAHRQAKKRAAQNNDEVSTHPINSAAPSVRAGRTRQTGSGTPPHDVHNDPASYELETLVAKELDDWRREVAGASQMRARHHRSATSSTTAQSIHESFMGAAAASVFSISSSMTSSIGQLSPNPSPMNRSLSHARRPSAPASVKSASNAAVPGSYHSRTPSVVMHGVSHPNSEADREVLSLPSRPDTPFSAVSVPRSVVDHPPVDHLLASDDDMDVFSIQSTASSDSAEENVRDDGSVWSLGSGTHDR